MEKTEQRAALKRLQRIVNGRGDGEVGKVMVELGVACGEIHSTMTPEEQDALEREDAPVDEPEEKPRRKRKTGRDRMRRGGRNRTGS